MDRVWYAFKQPSKPLSTSCRVKAMQGYEVKKVKRTISDLGGVLHAFMLFFHQERKKYITAVLNG